MAFLSSCLRTFLFVFVLPLLLLLFAPGIPPHDLEFEDETVFAERKVRLEGALAPNARLDEAEDLTAEVAEGVSLGMLKGPESFAAKDGYLYTGIQGGEIMRLNLKGGKEAVWEVVTKTGFPCSHQYEEKICGRPLGMDFDRHGNLIVLDAHYGIFRLNLATGKKETLVRPEEEVGGRRNVLFNSMAATIGGDIYYSVSSTRFSLHDGMLEVLSVSSPSGRLLKYNAKTKKSEVLLDDLVFANGVALSPREDFVLVNDLGRGRIMKVRVKTGGQGKVTDGEVEVFADVPGAPDNIRPNGDGGFLVGVVAPVLPGRFNLLADFVYPNGLVRKALTRLLYNAKSLFEFLHEMWPQPLFAAAAFWVANTELHAAALTPRPYGLVIEYDRDGNAVQSWHSPEGKAKFICEAFLHGGHLYLGSPYNVGVKRIKYDNVMRASVKREPIPMKVF